VTELLVATTNEGKFAEVQAYLKDFSCRISSLKSLENPPAVVEDGQTFDENALKKARVLAEFSGLITLADDSGLEVDALNGAPGIYSARYSGLEYDDARNIAKLLRELAMIPIERRTARFVCALALCWPRAAGGKEWTVRESCEGWIAISPKGTGGFGYDPVFFYPPSGKTFGEMDRETKARVSHRGKALGKLATMLPSLMDFAVKP
jgi:XTP/dITP diphosphohydrolase